MGFEQGLSGLSAASRQLEVIGNNVANSGTVGFKASQTQFADVYAASLNGAANGQAGIGVKVAAISQQFTQGTIATSSNPLDIAINGNGFFRLDTNGAVSYSRNGQFGLDKLGNIVNAAGAHLTGYKADAAGNIATGAPGDLNINTSAAMPRSTSKVSATMNLDARTPVLPSAGFDMNDSTTFTDSSSVNVFDSLGNPHTLQSYYVHTGAGTWDVFAATDGTPIGYTPPAAPVPVGSLTFKTDGSLDTTATTLPLNVSVPVTGGASSPLAVAMDFKGSSQYGENFAVTTLVQDGYAAGSLSSFSIGQDGIITGRYTNGTSSRLGQVALAAFKDPNGLQPLGDNAWSETAASGAALIGGPGTGSLGALTQGVEESNVDLTGQLVQMITAQRAYQANAQTVKTEDSILQTLMNLR